jgi:hypothetical protein
MYISIEMSLVILIVYNQINSTTRSIKITDFGQARVFTVAQTNGFTLDMQGVISSYWLTLLYLII